MPRVQLDELQRGLSVGYRTVSAHSFSGVFWPRGFILFNSSFSGVYKAILVVPTDGKDPALASKLKPQVVCAYHPNQHLKGLGGGAA